MDFRPVGDELVAGRMRSGCDLAHSGNPAQEIKAQTDAVAAAY
jgi:hypothetical protein